MKKQLSMRTIVVLGVIFIIAAMLLGWYLGEITFGSFIEKRMAPAVHVGLDQNTHKS